jgi:hypothetical protein
MLKNKKSPARSPEIQDSHESPPDKPSRLSRLRAIGRAILRSHSDSPNTSAAAESSTQQKDFVAGRRLITDEYVDPGNNVEAPSPATAKRLESLIKSASMSGRQAADIPPHNQDGKIFVNGGRFTVAPEGAPDDASNFSIGETPFPVASFNVGWLSEGRRHNVAPDGTPRNMIGYVLLRSRHIDDKMPRQASYYLFESPDKETPIIERYVEIVDPSHPKHDYTLGSLPAGPNPEDETEYARRIRDETARGLTRVGEEETAAVCDLMKSARPIKLYSGLSKI